MSQKPFRTLILWFIWAAVVLIICSTLYTGTGVWNFIEHDNSRITWLILGTFALAVVGSFVLALMITLEARSAHQVEGFVTGKGLRGLDGQGRIKYRVGRFFDGLIAAAKANNGGKTDIENLLTSELAIYQRISHLIEVVANLLITLGLIGTVLGLTLVLAGLTGSLEALGHDQEMLLSGLRKAMGGMGTAFYTTLLGAALGGVLLRVYAQITEHGVHGVYDTVMRTCLVHCAADLQPSVERDLRFLDSQIDALNVRIRTLQFAFKESQDAMMAFREEAARLRDVSTQENETLLENIRLHKYNIELMRDELKTLRRIAKPWWVRLREAIWASKT
jgi:hypothetical protein